MVDQYVTFLGRSEADNRNEIEQFGTSHLRRIAMRIGRGCMIAASHNAKAAQKLFGRVVRELAPTIARPGRHSNRIGRAALQLHSIAMMLQERDNPSVFEQARRNIHSETVRGVKDAYTKLHQDRSAMKPTQRQGYEGELRGELSQTVALGLLTRYVHPWFMSLPSLIHHDNGKAHRNNYDILLIESMPRHPVTNAYKLQVKTACIGVCHDQPSMAHVPQQSYARDITLVSACCDLQRGDERDSSLQHFRAAELLIKEYDEAATLEEILELDSYTDSLLLSVTMGDERRMGQLPA